MTFVFFMTDTPICLVMRNDIRYALSKFRFLAKVNKMECDITER